MGNQVDWGIQFAILDCVTHSDSSDNEEGRMSIKEWLRATVERRLLKDDGLSFHSCFSSVGNRHVGSQRLSIGTGCDRIATIEHEFLHTLGFWHEQSRPDRDDYVTIMWDRILDGRI